MARYGSPVIVHGVNIVAPAPPDAAIEDAIANPDGSVVFSLGLNQETILPTSVEFLYVPDGSLPDPVPEIAMDLGPNSVANGVIPIDGPGAYRTNVEGVPPGDYAVVLYPVFAD